MTNWLPDCNFPLITSCRAADCGRRSNREVKCTFCRRLGEDRVSFALSAPFPPPSPRAGGWTCLVPFGRQRILDSLLDDPLERASAVEWVISFVGDCLLRRFADDE